MLKYIVYSYNPRTGKRKSAPTIYDTKEKANRGVVHSLARSMKCLTKTNFSIYSPFEGADKYDYLLSGDRALIFERNNTLKKWETIKVIGIAAVTYNNYYERR